MTHDRMRAINGAYFPYCQFCVHDGSCALRHCDYLGTPEGSGVDTSPYVSHEDFAWAFSSFQSGTSRARCSGRILQIDSHFLPLQCECGTAINSLSFFHHFCSQFEPNEAGMRRRRLMHCIAVECGISYEEAAKALPEPDEDYPAAMFR
jgi:hypothetical protein